MPPPSTVILMSYDSLQVPLSLVSYHRLTHRGQDKPISVQLKAAAPHRLPCASVPRTGVALMSSFLYCPGAPGESITKRYCLPQWRMTSFCPRLRRRISTRISAKPSCAMSSSYNAESCDLTSALCTRADIFSVHPSPICRVSACLRGDVMNHAS